MNHLLKQLETSFNFWFLLIISFAFFLMRLPSFFEPYWYGDEGVYEVLGFGMRHGRLLYQGIWDNKPPLLYLIYALFDGNQPMVKVFSFLVGLVAVYFFFALSRLLFEKQKYTFIATGFFVVFLGLPFLEGNIANAENFMILPSVVSMYLIVRTIKNQQYNLFSFFFAGLLLGISFLIKVVAVFDFASLFLLAGFVLFTWNKTEIERLLFKFVVLSVGFIVPFIATLGFFAYKGILSTFIQSAFLSNVGYVNYGNQFLLPFTKIVIPQGFLLVKLIAVFLILTIIFLKRKSLSLLQISVYIWLPFSLFNAFFSQRPYTHYLLVTIAALSLLIGMVFEKKYRMFNGMILLATILLLATNFWFYGKIIGYYQNYFQLLNGQKTIQQYQSFFDKGVPRDYAIAQFLKQNMKPDQKVFLWTNSAQLYYLIQQLPLGRYTAAYHMALNAATLKETAEDLKRTRPDFVVVLPNASTFPFPMPDYKFRIDINGGLIYEKVF